jgi:3-dehydro-4-phosphotetronate decarboxylase
MTTAADPRDALAAELCEVGRSLYQRGYVHASAGNISARLPDGSILITPTDACLGRLEASILAHIGPDGEQIGGGRPSKALALHRAIYAAAPEASCVLHTHSRELVSLSLQSPDGVDDWLPPITPYFVMKVGRVPLLPYHRPGDPAVAEHVVQRIAQWRARGLPLRAVMLNRLGPTVWAPNPADASAVLEELEETALLIGRGHTTALDRQALDTLQAVFGAAW